MFDASVVRAFEKAAKVRLEREHFPELERARLTNPLVAQLPRIESYRSSETSNDLLGGHFTVKLHHEGSWPDEGVRDDTGVERYIGDLGPSFPLVLASARRANIELTFVADSSEKVTRHARRTWRMLTDCLSRLEAPQPLRDSTESVPSDSV